MQVGPQPSSAIAPEVPDFAFETGGVQQTLKQTLERGPVLLILFTPPAPLARLQQLAAAQSQLGTVGLHVIAVEFGPTPEPISGERPPLMVGVSSEVMTALALFRETEDGGETELMLDQAGVIRARWTCNMLGGLPPPVSLTAEAEHVARPGASTQNHAGHIH
jgi:hypothetical protein